MNYNAGLKSVLLSSSALILLAALTGNAGAQNVTISGDNALVENPCRTPATVSPIVTVPESCVGVTYTPQAPYSAPTFTLTDYYQTGIIIGKDGNGEVEITGGGKADTAHLVIGHEVNSSGSVLVSGDGSEYLGHSTTSVGNAGRGELIIRDGGVYRHVNTDYFYSGYEESGDGYIEVSGVAASGQRSSLITRHRIYVGNYGNATMNILDGGLVSAEYTSFIGAQLNSNSSMLVSGVNAATGHASKFEVLHNQLWIGDFGHGSISILDGGLVQVADGFQLGGEAEGVGFLKLDGVNESTGTRSTVKANLFRMGLDGKATAYITGGATVNTDVFEMATKEGSEGSLVISGIYSPLSYQSSVNTSGAVFIGSEGKASLSIEGGGLLNAGGQIILGNAATGEGELVVDGADIATGIRSETRSRAVVIGRRSRSDAVVKNGGLMTVREYLNIGHEGNGKGTLSVDGIKDGFRSEVKVSTAAFGGLGEADVFITNGGLISADNYIIAGAESGSSANIVVDGYDLASNINSNISAANRIAIGNHGNAVVSLSDRGTITTGELHIARQSESDSVLNVGTGGIAGIVNVTSIIGGEGSATLNFNHLDDIDFAPEMTGNINVNQINAGITTLNAVSDYSGLTTIAAGALRAGNASVFSANSDYVIDEFGMLDMDGYSQTLHGLNNAGLVRFGGNGGATLDISDNYTGAGGLIEFNTVLGDDTSLTDRMTAQDTAGSSFVRVINAGGTGAQTNDGIRLIEVSDPSFSLGTFSLLGDYVFEGDQAVVGGAYAYRLYQGATSAPDDGNWYLRSSLIPNDPDTPLYQPGVPIYESYAQSLLGLNGLSTLQQRVGNRYWAGGGNRVIAQGADAPLYYAPAEEAGPYTDGNGVWGRIEGAHHKLDPKFSTSGADYSQNVFRMQAGVDMLLSENMDGMLIGGVFAHYTHGKTKVRSIFGDGTISTDGYGLGGSLTWYDNEGFYVDGQAQATWYNSDLASTLANTGLVSGNKGFGYALSLETGKRFAITPEWSLTPQAQLTYSNVDFDSFRDVWNTHVSLDRGSRLEGRLGLSLDHESSWQNAAGMTDRAHVYGIANLYYGFTEGTKVNVANTQFHQEQERLWGGLGIGGSYNWNDDKYSLYGEGLINTSLNSFGDSYTLKGNVGFRVKW